MNVLLIHLASLSAKIALLGGLAWVQLFLLRRAPASSRSRLCSLALVAIPLLAGVEMLAPNWMVQTPVFAFTAASARGPAPVAAGASIGFWLGLIWLAGVAWMLTRAVAGRAALALVRRRATAIESESGVDVRIADVRTPILCGWLQPTILLPRASAAWTGEQRQMVLTHELTHFRQGDGWSNLLAQAIRAVLWFHPVVWLLASRLSREQELTCDEAVVASGHSCHDYAAFLLDAVRNLRSREIFVCAMAGSGAQSLKRRFANLLDARPRPVLTGRIALAMASLALIAITLTVVHPVWSQNESRQQAKVYKTGGDVTSPRVLSKVEPKYTEEARAAKIQGPVHLRVIVTPEGKAENIEVTSGIDPGLDQSAIDALSQWTFQPATKEGKAVAVWATVEINFRLL